MDAVLFHLFVDIPKVTRVWIMGCVGLSILTSLNLIDSAKIIYNYDLVFRRGQYQRILFSIFDYGELNWSSIVNIAISANHLTLLESSFNEKKRFLWLITLMLSIIIIMTGYLQPASSLGVILIENLVNFHLKKNMNEWNVVFLGVFNVGASLLPLYMYINMYFAQNKSFFEISMNFLPAHILFYFDGIVAKLYGIDLLKPPNDLWIDFQNWRLKDHQPQEANHLFAGESLEHIIEGEDGEEEILDNEHE